MVGDSLLLSGRRQKVFPGDRARRNRVSQPDRSPRHDDGAGPAGFSHVWRAGRIRAQPDPQVHPSGPGRRAARWPHGRPTAETHRRRHRDRQGDVDRPFDRAYRPEVAGHRHVFHYEDAAMRSGHKVIVSAFALSGLLVFDKVQVAKAQDRGVYCVGQYASVNECVKKSGGVWLQGFPAGGQSDCTNTCQMHPGKFLGCIEIHKYADHLCAPRHGVVNRTASPTNGNQCGYLWVTIDCQ